MKRIIICSVFLFALITLYSCKREIKYLPSLGLKKEIKKAVRFTIFETVGEIDFRIETQPLNCYFDKLSKQFNTKLEITRITEDSTQIIIEIFDKVSKNRMDKIIVETEWLMIPPMFENCDNVRSFTTGVNTEKEVIDNEHGDFIIADFNFDNLDDLAIAVDFGGNGGTIYSFYLQETNEKFRLDQYLSETMQRFPVAFDRKKKTLTTSVHANAYGNTETIYQFKNGQWKIIHQKFVQ